MTRKTLSKPPRRVAPSYQEARSEVIDELLSILIPSTAKHWAVIFYFYDDINQNVFKKVVEVFENNGKIKASMKEWNARWQKNWEKKLDIGEDNFLPEWTMIDKELVGDESLELVRCDVQRLERFVRLFNDENYQYNKFTKNCQLFVDDLLIFLDLKPIQRVLPWSLDFVVTFMMLLASTPFSYNYITQETSYHGKSIALFVFNDWDTLLMFSLLAACYVIVFLLRNIFGGVFKTKYLVIGWIHIICLAASYLGLMPALMFYHMQWLASFVLFVWYRLFRLKIYGNELHYPKSGAWF